MNNNIDKNKNCCIYCYRRTDKTGGVQSKTIRKRNSKRCNLLKYRRKVSELWLIDFMKSIERNVDFFKWICHHCFKKLKASHESSTLYLELLNKCSIKEKMDESTINHESSNELSSTSSPVINDFALISDDRSKKLMGLNREEFLNVYNEISEHELEIKTDISLINALGLYLTKLRSGLSIPVLRAMLPIVTQPQTRRAIGEIRIILYENFTKKHLGFKQMSRDELIKKHTTDLSRKLLGAADDDLITIWDTTHLFIEKSSNQKMQKRSFSMHKCRTLLKFMNLVATSGHMIDTVGPYLCDNSNNDASILKNIFERKIIDLEENFKKDDIFVVDRGFRDCLKFLEENEMRYEMPSYLLGNKQHTTRDANYSRIVTKIRWVVESVNARIKKWKYFSNTINNKEIPTVEYDYKNLCALINFLKPVLSEIKDIGNIGDKMLAKVNTRNPLVAIASNISKRKSQKNIVKDFSQLNFPVLTEEYLKAITFGVYQLKQTQPYIEELIDEKGKYCFELFKEENIIRVKINSRFRSNVVHNSYIQLNNRNKIQNWYCDCKIGARNLGACSHITSILWFFGVKRGDPSKITDRPSTCYILFCLDCRDNYEIVDGSDIEDSDSD